MTLQISMLSSCESKEKKAEADLTWQYHSRFLPLGAVSNYFKLWGQKEVTWWCPYCMPKCNTHALDTTSCSPLTSPASKNVIHQKVKSRRRRCKKKICIHKIPMPTKGMLQQDSSFRYFQGGCLLTTRTFTDGFIIAVYLTLNSREKVTKQLLRVSDHLTRLLQRSLA